MASSIKLKDRKYIVIYYKNHKFSTGISLPEFALEIPSEKNPNPKNIYWNFKTSKLKKDYGKDYQEVNNSIETLKNTIDKLILEAKQNNTDEIAFVKNHFLSNNNTLKNEILTKETPLIKALEKWGLDNKKNKQEVKTIINHIKYFNKDVLNKKNEAMLIDIDINWIEKFIEYCVCNKERAYEVYRKSDNITYTTIKKLKMSNSSLKKHLTNLIAFFKDIMNTNDNIKLPIKALTKITYGLATSYEKKTMKEEHTYSYLTNDEWEVIKHWKISNDRRAEWHICLDLFKFSIVTGLRFSDLTLLCLGHIKNNVISLHPKKTKNKVLSGAINVPLNEMAQEIIKKYTNQNTSIDTPIFANVIKTNQRMNLMLRKILAEIPIFNKDIEIRKYYNNEIISSFVKKHESITWHSARRTFVSLCVKNGCDIQQLQTFTGWVDIKTLQSYLDILRDDDLEKSKAIINAF